MNPTLFRSKHGPIAAGIVALFIALSFAWDAPFGRGAGGVRTFLLATGWTTLAMMLVVMAYVLRKYMHRGRYSPEFKMRVQYAALEKADNEIRRMRQKINAGSLGSAKAIEKEAKAILRKEGVHKVNRVLVEPGPPGGEPWTLRIVPTEPLGRVARWMHVHAFYGMAFGALLLMHGGPTPGSPFGWALAGLGYLVFITGILGIVLWAFGPRWLTRAERDLSIEEASALHQSLARKRAEAVASFDGDARKRVQALAGSRAPSASQVRGVLGELDTRSPGQLAPLQDVCALIAQERAVGKELRALRRVRASFMAWKFVHIPAAVLLTGLVAVHVLSIWKY